MVLIQRTSAPYVSRVLTYDDIFFPETIQMLLTGESEFFHPAPSPANLNLNLSLEFNSTTDVNVDYEVIIILTNDYKKLS